MLFIRRFMALILAFIGLLGFDFSAAELNFDNAIISEKRDYCFDNDRLLIGGYNYDMAHNDDTHVAYVKEAGIDFLVTSVNEEFLDRCDKAGVGVISTGYNLPFYVMTGDTTPWQTFDYCTYKDHECLWGDNLMDEPFDCMFTELGQTVAHYYENAPGKIPLINLFPIYAGDNQLGNPNTEPVLTDELDYFAFGQNDTLSMNRLEYSFYGTLGRSFARMNDYTDNEVGRYVRHVNDYIDNVDTDYICVDLYPLYLSNVTGNWMRNLDILSEACRNTNKDLWVITQAAGEVKGPARYCDRPEDIRWQMYTSLAFGAKAVIHGCYDSGWFERASHLIDADGNRTDTYYAVQTVDNEVAPFKELYADFDHIGTFLTNGGRATGTNSGYLTPMTEEKGCNVFTTAPVLTGCFKKEDARAYVFVNMFSPDNGKSAKLCVTFDDAEKITVYRKGNVIRTEGNSLNLTLENNEGVFVTVE